MTRSKSSALAVLAALFTVAAATGSTAVAAGSSAADSQALQSFRLTPQFLENYEAYQEEAVQKPCDLDPMIALQKASSESQSLDATIAAFDARPGVHEALKRHGLTARDMILGFKILMGAAVQEIAAKHPDMVKSGQIQSQVPVSPENLAFYQQHKDEIHRHQMELARAQLKRNGGQLPACLKSAG